MGDTDGHVTRSDAESRAAPATGSRTLRRGLDVVQALGTSADGATVAELSSATGLDRAVVYRLLETLSGAGFVVRDVRTLRFHLGVTLVELGARATRSLEVRRMAAPRLRALVDAAGEAACLAVRDRDDVVVVDRVEPPVMRDRVAYEVGLRHPLAIGAHGRALLAFLGRTERVGLSADAPAFEEELRATRARGFALATDELERGMSAVSAPILDRTGQPVASLGLVGPSARLAELAALGERVHHQAMEVSRRLGYQGAAEA